MASAVLTISNISFIRAVKEQQRAMERMRPALLQMSEMAMRITEAYAPMIRISQALAESLRPTLEAHRRLHEAFGISVITTVEPAAPIQAKPVAIAPVIPTAPLNTDISYDHRELTLSRTVNGAYRQYVFENKTRGRLFAWLFTARKFVSTEELRIEFGRNNTAAIRKIVQGVNDEAKKKLGIKQSVIVGKRGSGYRTNPDLFIHRT